MGIRRTLLLLLVAGCTLFATACNPKYPKCNDDEDCRKSDKGQAEGKLFCVNNLCQECKEDADCGDPSMECNAGVCDKIPGYCTSVDDCPGNQKCRDSRCGPECQSDDECGDGEECKGGNCVAKAECTKDADCADGQVCEGGKCVSASSECSLDTVYFSYDSSVIDDSAKSQLRKDADCIKKKNLSVTIEGHCDERGTSEYNIALGERRARNVYKYLRNLGIAKSKMETISYGEERLARQCGEQGPESCHRQNRRVEFVKR